MYVAWHVQTTGLCIPRFLQQGDNFLTILRQIQTPQEVVVWFGCGKEKKKGKGNSFGLVNKRFGLLPMWGKSPS